MNDSLDLLGSNDLTRWSLRAQKFNKLGQARAAPRQRAGARDPSSQMVTGLSPEEVSPGACLPGHTGGGGGVLLTCIPLR